MRHLPPQKFNYTKQSSIYLSTRLLNTRHVKRTIITNNWVSRHTTFPSVTSAPLRVTCWGQSSSQQGGSKNSFLHGAGLINQRQKRLCVNQGPACSQRLISSFSLLGKSLWEAELNEVWKCRLYRKSWLDHLHNQASISCNCLRNPSLFWYAWHCETWKSYRPFHNAVFSLVKYQLLHSHKGKREKALRRMPGHSECSPALRCPPQADWQPPAPPEHLQAAIKDTQILLLLLAVSVFQDLGQPPYFC